MDARADGFDAVAYATLEGVDWFNRRRLPAVPDPIPGGRA
jgi:hypothetical protein